MSTPNKKEIHQHALNKWISDGIEKFERGQLLLEAQKNLKNK